MVAGMKQAIKQAIEEVLKEMEVFEINFAVDFPTDKETKADYFSNIALVLGKQLNKNPADLASLLANKLENKLEEVSHIEVAGPGFLNFYLNRSFYTKKITEILNAKEDWGKNDSWSGKKVIVEYTDPNPFKEFHIGHLFTNVVGESIARLFMMNGADTKRVNYQGDVGLHVAKAIWGIKKFKSMTLPEEGLFHSPSVLGKAYAIGATAYNEDEKAAEEIRNLNKVIYERRDEEVNKLYDDGKKISLDYFETIYEMLDTTFDAYFFESETGPKGKELVLEHPEVFAESNGAWIFDGEAYGLHTRVFLNKEGLPTYEAKELALAKIKEDELGEYDHSVISTANEINEYFKVLKKAMSFVYPELEKKTEHIGHGMVRLASGKMSSRTGEVIPATEFISEVATSALEKLSEPNTSLANDIAIAAIKYSILKGSIFQDSVFDKEQALSFEGDSGPYLQYTFARISSVLRKAEAVGVNPSTKLVPKEPYLVEGLLHQFPEIVAGALLKRSPHKITQYLTELSGAFNSMYAEERIADSSDEYAPYKAALAAAIRQTLKNGLWILAIKAPEQM